MTCAKPSHLLLQRHALRNVSCHKFSAINAPTVAQSPTQWTNELSHHTVHYRFAPIFTTSLLHMLITCCWKKPEYAVNMKMTPEQACREKQEEKEQRLSLCVRKTGLKGRTGSVFVLFRFWFKHVWLNDFSIRACNRVAYDVAPVKKYFSVFEGDDVGLALSAPAADEREWRCEWRPCWDF